MLVGARDRAAAGRSRRRCWCALHPRDDIEHYAEFEGVPGVIIEKPFKPTVRAGDGMAVDVTRRQPAAPGRHDASQRRHRATWRRRIAIEAAIFDTPVVNIVVRRRDAVRVRAVGAALLPVHALRRTSRATARCAMRGDAGASWSTHVGRYLRRSRARSRRPPAGGARAVSVSRRPRPPNASPAFVVDGARRPSTGRHVDQLTSCAALQASSR